MDDIESLCNRVLILNEGKIFLDGSLEDLRKKMQPERRLIVDLQKDHHIISEPNAIFMKKDGHRVWLSYDPTKTTTPELIANITAKYAIRDLYVENPPIEEIIARFYKDVNL